MISKKGSLAAIAVSFTICSLVSASTIVDFKPLPVSPLTREFLFDRALGGGIPVFRGGPGATGNADGVLPVPAQTPGGLDAETPFLIPGIPGSQLNFGIGSTEFYDSTLEFTAGLQANAPAVNGSGMFSQPLSPGSFRLLSTDPDGPGALLPTLLLSGNITAASFIVGVGDAGAAFSSQDVNYTGGVIFNALIAAGGNPNGNSMSISMTDVAPSFGIAGDNFLADFGANATGLFNANAVPEPTSLIFLGIAAGVFFVRRR